MKLERTLFLTWLLYAVIIAFASVTGYQLGYFQVAITSDPTYITVAIFIAYLVSESFVAWNIWKVDKEIEITNIILKQDDVTIENIPDGILKTYVANLKAKKGTDQAILLEALGDDIYAKNYGAFMGDLVVRLGLLGTIIGLIMAFLPFIEQSFAGGAFAPEQIQSIITSLFIGISAAFFTTAAGIICGTFLTISGRIYEAGADKLLSNVAVIMETKIIPKLGD